MSLGAFTIQPRHRGPGSKGRRPEPRPAPAVSRGWRWRAIGILVIVAGIAYLVFVEGSSAPGPAANTPEEPQPPPDPGPPLGDLPPIPGREAAIVAPPPAPAAAVDKVDAKVLQAVQLKLTAAPDPVARCKQVVELLHTGDLAEKRAVAELLGEDPASAAFLPAAIQVADRRVLGWLAMAAMRLEAKQAVGALIDRASQDGADAGLAVFRAIGQLGGDGARQFLRARLAAADQRVRALAWDSFPRCATVADLDVLGGALEQGDAVQRAGALRSAAALGTQIGAQHTIQELIERGLKHEKEQVQLAYAEAAAQLPAQRFNGLLSSLIYSTNPALRAWGIRGLGRDPLTAAAVPGILGSENDPRVVAACLEALTWNPRAEAVPKLLQLIYSQDDGVSALALKALTAAFGQDFGQFPDAWKIWYEAGESERDPGRLKAFRAAEDRREEQRRKAPATPPWW